ncbi:MAG: DNA-directed RNA polymerase subunit omega [Fimbriimonadales bacterium]|jgi:DNA-directed RNA polymerase omega subunit|nr:DNA-directed RNA polymerase subunit omega [Armatimonadota bacterium]MCX7687807.1 DNA-directed RNA polymerase subunit omega [Fimbriimonadales bacterium]CUU05933.1 DNA-directed RNA polymerase, omega subunit [Armatimonadetes bacterium GBS]CUU37602.1 DNA-directed RNA polymerase, omega subunit [Armatimonadetes bacterium DC]CUU37772.1 DNA-directed RNA polymerase, omega subunit [Armatimonadetes bacterium GXS]GBC89812.1 DNA-directed RNA polymerase subunit omega [bacterium HR14]
MIFPENDELIQYPRYILALLAAERARLLKAGAKPLVPVNGVEFNPLSVALEEIAQGKIKPLIIDENRVEVLIQGPEHTWQLSTLQDLDRRIQEETEDDTELREFYESELAQLLGTEGSERGDAEQA